MKIISTKNEKHATVFEVELDLAAYKKEYANAKKNIAKNISIPGFRKGHVPANIIDERVKPIQIGYEAISKLENEIFKTVFESKEFENSDCIDSVSNIELAKFDADKSAPVIKVHCDLIPKILGFTKKDLQDIVVPPFKDEINEEFIQQQIKSMIKRDAMTSDKNGAIAKNDIAVIDFKGFVDGKTFAGGEAKDFELEIGSKSFVDNFEDQLIGHKKGDKVDVNVTFPKQYQKNLAGKKAKFEVVVKNVKTIEYPEITKDYLKKFGIEASTRQELENYLRDLFNQRAELQYQNQCGTIINEAIAKKAKLDYYPVGLLNTHIKQVLRQYEQEALRAGYKTLTAYKKSLKLDDDKFKEIVENSAKTTLAIALVYDRLMEETGLKVEETDKNEYLKKLTRYVGDAVKAKKQYEKDKDYCDSVILRNKLMKKMIEYCKKELKAEQPK